jgi:hypothetical protein
LRASVNRNPTPQAPNAVDSVLECPYNRLRDMKTSADDWPHAPLNGVLIASIVFLTLLPSLGWAWHRVLPEHTHVFVGVAHSDEEEIVATSPAADELAPCVDCGGTQIRSGLLHLPDATGLQVLGVAAILGALFLGFLPPALPEPIVISPSLYRSPNLLFPDPPPNMCGLV